MITELYEDILNKAMRINVEDNSEIEIGIFIGMVIAYNKLSDNEIIYSYENGKILTMEHSGYRYLWNEWNKSFDWRCL